MNYSIRSQQTSTLPDGSTQTVITDYANVMTECELSTQRMDSPAKLEFTCIEKNSYALREGAMVEFIAEGVKMFQGFIFTVERNKDGEVTYTAYDQLRYLKANASYTFENMTLEDIIRRIAADFGLTVGTLAETGYVFPSLVKEDEGCLDIIFDALSQVIVQTGKIYNFYDNAGALTLTEAKDMYTDVKIGDGSLVTDYTYKRDIDEDTYNRIKLVRPNKETGRADVYVHEDTDHINAWGLLQYYAQVDENMNAAQIDELCRLYLEYYNRVLQTLEIESLGVIGLRAGMIVPVQISAVDDLAPIRLLIAEEVKHSFESDVHTMTIEVKSFDQLGGLQIGMD